VFVKEVRRKEAGKVVSARRQRIQRDRIDRPVL
jgi:hypothetical protein